MRQFKREPLTEDEANRIAAACRTDTERLVIYTLLDTGLRVSEFCSIDRDRLDWQNHRVNVYGKGGPYGARSKRRVVPLSARVAPLLESTLSIHRSIGAPELRLSPRSVQRMVKELASRARISRPCSPHVLRHTFAITANARGISLSAIQKILGHDSIQTTEIYLNMSPEIVLQEFRDRW